MLKGPSDPESVVALAENASNSLSLNVVEAEKLPCVSAEAPVLRLVDALEGGIDLLGSPAPARTDRLQHVECHGNDREHPEHGTQIWLQARVEWSTGAQPLVGHKVYFHCRPGVGNTSPPTDCGFRDGDESSVESDTEDTGWAQACFWTSSTHGDVFDLHASLDADPSVAGIVIGRFQITVPEVRVVEFVELGEDDAVVPAHRSLTQYACRTRTVPRPDFGHTLRMKARLEFRDAVRSGESLANRRVYFYGEMNRTVDRNEPDGALQGFDGAQEQLAVDAGADGWTAPVTFRLGTTHRGRYELKATELAAYQRGLSLGTYEVDDAPVPAVRVVEIVAVKADGSPYAPAVVLATTAVAGVRRRQYVNIDAVPVNDLPRCEYGRTVRVKVRVEPIAADAVLADAVVGQSVFVYQSSAVAQVVTATHAAPANASFSGAGTEFTAKGRRSTIDPTGWSNPIAIRLGEVGGDVYDFCATTEGDGGGVGGLATGEIEVWRKLWFQVASMRKWAIFGVGEPRDVPTDAVAPAYAPGFIELERTGAVVPLDYEETLYSDHRMLDYARDHMAVTKNPFKINVLVVEKIMSQSDKVIDLSVTGNVYVGSQQKTIDLPRLDLWRKSAQYRRGSGAWHALPLDRITQVTPNAARTNLSVDLSGLNPAPSKAAPVSVKLVLRVFHDHAAGLTRDYPHIYMNLSESLSEQLDRALDFGRDFVAHHNETIAHEIGHTLTMVPNNAPTYDNVHTAGGHCTNQACIMFWTMNKNPYPNQFCASCRRMLATRTDFGLIKASFTPNL